MNQNDSWLKYFITEEIYPLVETDLLTSGPDEKNVDPEQLEDFEGKSLLLLFRGNREEALSEREATFLDKIISAVNLSEKDCVTLYLPGQTPELPKEIFTKGLQRVIAFDPSIRLFEMQHDLYMIHDHQGTRWLVADKLEEIAGDVEKKKALWMALKKMFELD